MTRQDITLHDKFDLSKQKVLLNGTQALVRLMLMQKARDKAAGLNTAGYVTGYRGSPLGAVDQQMNRAESDLRASDIVFEEGLNEDLAATAVWGTQQAELRGEGKFDGVFGLWYGKGPGVDRSGDVMRHANFAGTSPHGGVLMAMGDDHTGESSTTCHQSDWAMVDAFMPVLSPAGVQEILDYGLYGFALSRFSGLWAGLKLMKDTVEVTSVVDARPDRMSFIMPDFEMPEGGLNIRLVDHWIDQEARTMEYKRFAAEAFANANKMDNRVWGKPGAKIGFVAAGKNWLDLIHSLALLGIDEDQADHLGITTYKVGQVWPLDRKGFMEWADGLDLIVVVEEKRKLIEVQIKEVLFDAGKQCRVYGGMKNGVELFPTKFALNPVDIAKCLGQIFIDEGRGTDGIRAALKVISEADKANNAPELAARLPYFCSGCPHNTSTKIPEGSRAYAGIGCHFMAQWMDRDTLGFTHMGGEGANWMGESKFSTREHVFQNIGDGTYNHSGIQAIRAAIAAGTTMTYKILFNDAVAMTGGQLNDGGLDAARIAHEIQAFGVEHIAVVYDDKEDVEFAKFPKNIPTHTRDHLQEIQEKFSNIKGVSVIIYIQTCAAEKRRRRKRGTFPDPDQRVYINPAVCEGCGDCGVQSNCVSIVPLETELGRKRAIDQSSCNKDFSCLQGFCPSFVTVKGAMIKKQATTSVDTGDLSDPNIPEIDGTHNIVITGVGGTGVVTIGAVLAMAAHLDGKGVGMTEMAGLAQKGGAVHIHCRLANRPEDISAIRVATGECDTLIGGDLVVSAGAKTLGLMKSSSASAVVNSHEIITGDFTRDTEFRIPFDRLELSLHAKMKDRVALFDASALARVALGDSIFSNMMMLGAAWQNGLVPLSEEAISQAITLNGTAVEANLKAFELGRWAVVNPKVAANIATPNITEKPLSIEELIAYRADRLVAYQSKRLAKRYRKRLDAVSDPRLKAAMAKGYHKVLAYKDEYEVARLLIDTEKRVREEFDGNLVLTYHLAPPIFSGKAANGRPKKRDFGENFARLFPLLARFKGLRGTPFDIFGYSKDRKLERALIRQYESDMKEVANDINALTVDAAVALAELPLQIRGFGPVKEAAYETAMKRRDELLQVIRSGGAPLQNAAE
ncbi:MAG: indolepyruvate ferredoxin oxidoreductase family protein [Paracoccaceae bacterium]